MLEDRIRVSIVLLLLSSVLIGCVGMDQKTRSAFESAVKTRYSRFLQVDGTRIHYYERFSYGVDTSTVVLVHGWMGSAYDFINILGLFPPGFRVIAVDLPGCGLSEARDNFGYTVESFVSFLKEFIGVLGVREFVLVGHSMGGIIAINFALAYPELVERLVLISPDGLKGEEGIWLFFGRLGPITDLLGMMNNRFFVKMGMRLNVFYDDSKITEELLDSVALSALTERGRGAQLKITRNIVGEAHVDALLARIDKPTLIIWGKNDGVLSVKWAKKFKEGIKNSRLVVLDKCGHMPMFEKPYTTIRYINSFLERRKIGL